MAIIWIVTGVLFVIFMYLFWRFTKDPMKREYGEKMWNQWSSRMYYWQFGIYASTGLTLLTVFVLKWVNILSF